MRKAENVCNVVSSHSRETWCEYSGMASGGYDAPLQSGLCFYHSNMNPEHQEKIKIDDTEVLRDPDAWKNAPGWSSEPEIIIPDFIYRKGTLSGETFFIVGEVKSSKLSVADKMKVWNQALIGLTLSKQTVAVYIEPNEAGIITITIEGNNIYTYKKEYKIGERSKRKVKQGDTVAKPDEFCRFFRDLVLTMCHHCFSI